MPTATSELIDALFAGLAETPLWETFLDRLRREAAADHAFFYCHPPGGAYGRGVYRLSGEIDADEDEEGFFRNVWPMGPPPSEMFDEGRAYDLLETIRSAIPARAALRRQFERYSISALRLLKVTEPSGVEAWLFLSKMGGDFDSGIDGTLQALAPVIRGVVQVYVRREQERYRAVLGMEAARRARAGWLTLDASCRVIEHDEGVARLLSASTELRIEGDGRLATTPARFQRQVQRIVRCIVEGGSTKPSSLALSRNPWIELTIQPTRRTPVSTSTPAIALMYVHHDAGQPEHGERLRTAFGLSQREAELALLLGHGRSIVEAAEDLGLTVLTVRSYLRSIYSKTGAAGLADLVRIVARSFFISNA